MKKKKFHLLLCTTNTAQKSFRNIFFIECDMLFDTESKLASTLHDRSRILLSIFACDYIKDRSVRRQPVALTSLVYDFDNVARKRLEKLVILATVVQYDHQATLQTSLHGKVSV